MSLPQYKEFPKQLTHPHYQPAIVSDDSERGAWAVGHAAQPGRPAQFPPVVVHSADQEEYYVSRGYNPGTTTAPEEWQRRRVAPRSGPQIEYPKMRDDGTIDYGPDELVVVDKNYPKWVTLPDGQQAIANSAEHEARLCPPPEPTEADLAEALAQAEAAAAKVAELQAKLAEKRAETPTETDERERLLLCADYRSVQIDRRWGVAKLREAIAAAGFDPDAEFGGAAS